MSGAEGTEANVFMWYFYSCILKNFQYNKKFVIASKCPIHPFVNFVNPSLLTFLKNDYYSTSNVKLTILASSMFPNDST